MAFFVSKDLEGRVDESSLIEISDPKKELKEFVLEVDKITCKVIEVNFWTRNIMSIKCEGNIHAVDKLTFSNSKCKVYFKNKSIEIDTFKIVNILKKDNDTYIISISGIIPRGKINV
jgi:hypothetical protein